MKLFSRLIHWMYVEKRTSWMSSTVAFQEFYNCKYDPKNPEFWKQIELANGALFWLAWGWKIKKLIWKKSVSRLFAYKLLQETGMQTGNWSWEFWCSMFCPSIGVSIASQKKKYHHTAVDDWNAAPVDTVVLSHEIQPKVRMRSTFASASRWGGRREKMRNHTFFLKRTAKTKERQAKL